MGDSPERAKIADSETLTESLSFGDGRYVQREVLGVGGEKVVYLVDETLLQWKP